MLQYTWCLEQRLAPHDDYHLSSIIMQWAAYLDQAKPLSSFWSLFVESFLIVIPCARELYTLWQPSPTCIHVRRVWSICTDILAHLRFKHIFSSLFCNRCMHLKTHVYDIWPTTLVLKVRHAPTKVAYQIHLWVYLHGQIFGIGCDLTCKFSAFFSAYLQVAEHQQDILYGVKRLP